MTIDRTIDHRGGIHETIKLTASEIADLEECHNILRKRFEARGKAYDRYQEDMCEWWLLGHLRFGGAEKMMDMAINTPFHEKRRLVAVGYAETKEV